MQQRRHERGHPALQALAPVLRRVDGASGCPAHAVGEGGTRRTFKGVLHSEAWDGASSGDGAGPGSMAASARRPRTLGGSSALRACHTLIYGRLTNGRLARDQAGVPRRGREAVGWRLRFRTWMIYGSEIDRITQLLPKVNLNPF